MITCILQHFAPAGQRIHAGFAGIYAVARCDGISYCIATAALRTCVVWLARPTELGEAIFVSASALRGQQKGNDNDNRESQRGESSNAAGGIAIR